MNIHSIDIDAIPTREEAEVALSILRRWTDASTREEVSALDPASPALREELDVPYPLLSRAYPENFKVTPDYKDSLPDLQNGPESLIKGAHRRIQHVGISNFRLPLSFRTRDGAPRQLETSVTGSVSLEADKKGINMSRIMRSFYAHAGSHFDFDVIEAALDDYKRDLDSFDARIQLRTSMPFQIESLRSGLSGWQYYDVAHELIEKDGIRQRVLHLDYVYSSTCPCSLELSEHARRERQQLATPHSQRSVARLSMVLDPDGGEIFVEDVIEICRRAIPTETQVMVKREDEQAFAELNAANPIFVEDAARLFAEGLQADHRIGDFRVVASHQESLHSHDAISVLTEGATFDQASIDPRAMETLIHRG